MLLCGTSAGSTTITVSLKKKYFSSFLCLLYEISSMRKEEFTIVDFGSNFRNLLVVKKGINTDIFYQK